MSWLTKIAQIPATFVGTDYWYHGTDNLTAYALVHNMLLKPRSETNNTSYIGSLSSIPNAVYLTSTVFKAAKHAIDRSTTTGGHPVIFVIDPKELGMVHVDEDFVHQILRGLEYYDNDYAPSPALVQEIFELADEQTRATDYYPDMSVVRAVKQYFREGGSDAEIDDDMRNYLREEEGIVPDEVGEIEYDECMHVAKYISASLNDQHQKEAIMNFNSLAHQGMVRAKEVYLIPWQIDLSSGQDGSYMVSVTNIRSYEDLKKYGTRIDPSQLTMEFMR